MCRGFYFLSVLQPDIFPSEIGRQTFTRWPRNIDLGLFTRK